MVAKLLPANERDPREYVLIFKQLVHYDESINLSTKLSSLHALLSFIESIFTSRSTAETFLYFCLKGAATSWTLQSELNMPESTSHRALKRLRSVGVIEPATRIAKLRDSRGGPRPVVWALLESTKEEIAGAVRLHLRLLSPKYRLAREAAQTIMDDYLAPRQVMEISYREIMIRVKEMRMPYMTPDIAQLAAQYLHERGVTVWR